MPLKRYEKELGTFAKVPDAEPVFIFRASDPASVAMLIIYFQHLTAIQKEIPCNKRAEKIISVQAEIELFERWQKEQAKLK